MGEYVQSSEAHKIKKEDTKKKQAAVRHANNKNKQGEV
jgi:hypothetical protein